MKLRHLPLLAALAVFAGASFAGGYVGPGSDAPKSAAVAKVTTVKEAMAARDDTPVVLEGNIIQHIRGDHYLFRDATGEIRVDIDSDEWPAEKVSETTRIRVTGEVDTERSGNEIDVDRVDIIQ